MLQSAPRRYPLYWDSRSAKGSVAQQLISSQRGLTIEASSADELFQDLAASIDALEKLAEPPLTTAVTIARMKRCLHDPVRRVELHDLVMGRAHQVAETIDALPVTGGSDYGVIDERLAELFCATSPLLRLLIEGVHHDDAGDHTRLWIDVLQRLLDARHELTGQTLLLDLQHYPALLALRTMSIVVVHRGRNDLLIDLFTLPQWEHPGKARAPKHAVNVLHPAEVLNDNGWIDQLPRWGTTRGWLYPSSHLLNSDLSPLFADYLTGSGRYNIVSDDVEYLTGLAQTFLRDPGAHPPNSGEFLLETKWDHGDPERPHSEVRFKERIDARGPGAWTRITPTGAWEDKYLDEYRAIISRYRRWA